MNTISTVECQLKPFDYASLWLGGEFPCHS
jgi:hypothetical protein